MPDPIRSAGCAPTVEREPARPTVASLRRRVRRSPLAALALLLAGGVVLAACSSTSSSAAAATRSPTSSSSSSTSAALRTATSSTYGTYLTNSSGYAVYTLSSDPPNKSTCSGACVALWPPLVVSGTPAVASGVSSADVGTITRSSGHIQVTYNHHPLYTFTHDTAPGQTHGEGIVAFGGTWTLMSPSGKPIAPTAKAAAPAKSSSTSSSSGGYTY
ncbi:MAG: hypothetical protein M0Z82_08720 [Actinomycetota bacterium]|nr:hypothetical protein [Actinomycetota bacterium]